MVQKTMNAEVGHFDRLKQLLEGQSDNCGSNARPNLLVAGFSGVGGWHELVVGDRESGGLQEGTRDFDGVSEIAGHPEAQCSER